MLTSPNSFRLVELGSGRQYGNRGLSVSTFSVDFRHIHYRVRISSAKRAGFACGYSHLILLGYFKRQDERGAVELVINEL
jgi:hypothetical protein